LRAAFGQRTHRIDSFGRQSSYLTESQQLATSEAPTARQAVLFSMNACNGNISTWQDDPMMGGAAERLRLHVLY
jgi:hypothetical protein